MSENVDSRPISHQLGDLQRQIDDLEPYRDFPETLTEIKSLVEKRKQLQASQKDVRIAVQKFKTFRDAQPTGKTRSVTKKKR